jgi:lipopolysaccharide/colanic/teichoic acid biosynthesis glycosyltransferase
VPAPGDARWGELRPRGSYARFGKPCLTWSLLVLTLPFALLLAVPIALVNWALFGDPRKILYSQPRAGLRGRTFWIYKFRTMREASVRDIEAWGTDADRLRVTTFGRFLRCTHLDELPQFLNVLRGEMAFIGPRPEMVEIAAWAEANVPGFHRRLALRPGITGLAQVTLGYTGREAAAYAAKLAADERYRRGLSLALDLRILALTAVWMLRGKGWAFLSESHPSGSETGQPDRREAA